MKRIKQFIDSIISLFLAEKFIRTFSVGWTRFVRTVNAKKILCRMEDVIGRTHTKKKNGRMSAYRYERGANGQIRKVAA